MSEKTKGEMLRDELFYKKQSLFDVRSIAELDEAREYAKGYAQYLDNSKTEREAVKTTAALLKDRGYTEYKMGDKVVCGGKYYLNNRGKSIFAFRMGSEMLSEGIRICAAHIDSPRLDLKQNPLFEDNGFGYLKTHYYGGIRKYQWPTIQLALHGVVTKRGGETVEITIGEDAGDPVFVITDLLPHLSREQDAKTLNRAFTGEGLNLLIGSTPYYEEDGTVTKVDEKVKLNLMAMLNEKYGIVESDFMCAELCAVPKGRAVDIGLDRWLMGAYGHDDKVCAYPALTALLDTDNSVHTVMCVLADKEETGSDGTTGMQCSLLSDLIDELCISMNVDSRVCRANSMCLSADVNAGFDPLYPDVFEKRNCAIVNCGVVMSKYTGSGGKYSTNDASAEFVGKIRDMFGEEVLWQTAELGRIDAGGGGTVAKYVANCNIDTVDLGVPVLSMHAPFEVISKGDLYETHKAFRAFCK
ncbi:MAG: aminopeptidase [Clostridia bacterium]|nr:aminopeptidase [Clostridia bacterium]